MHAAGIQFHHSIFIREPTQSDSIVVRVVFLRFADLNGDVESIGTVEKFVDTRLRSSGCLCAW